MANEFVARNGIIALDNSTITGSLIVSAGITGSLFGTASVATSASYALTASFALNASAASGDKIVTGSVTASVNIAGTTFQLISASSTFLFVSNSGNIGINTTTPSARLQVSGSSNVVNFRGSGSAASSSIFSIDGAAGRLFNVNDSLSGSLFSVNTIAGLPVIEAFSDNTVRIGQYGQKGLFVSQSNIGIGVEVPTSKVHISGSTGGLLEVDGVTNTNILYVSASGRIGMGTLVPTANLHITASTGAILEVDGIIDNILYVSASGNVGIRTGIPTSASLHVSGNVFADSYTGSLLGTASFATSASFALTASYAANAASSYVTFNRQTANYTLALTDVNKIVEINSASANTVTVPSSSVVDFLTGSQITVVQYGAGQTSISGSTTGVTIRSTNNWLKINARYGAVTLTKIGGNEWYLHGNLNA